jgi:undecaprenyl-phosphate galactose phosphotransferase
MGPSGTLEDGMTDRTAHRAGARPSTDAGEDGRHRFHEILFGARDLSNGRPVISGRDFRRRQRLRSQARSATLLAGDIGAIVAANILALFASAASPDEIIHRAVEHSSRQGLAWHAWGSGLITLVLCAHLIGRGHYRLRITFWAQSLDIISASLLAFVCDVLLTTLIYREPANATLILHWLLLTILILGGRSITRWLLGIAGLWRIRALIVGEGEFAERARVVLTADHSMGYEIALSVPIESVMHCHEQDDWYRLLAVQNAEIIAIAGAPGTSREETHFMAMLSLTRIPLIFIPAFDSMSVVGCESQHVHRHHAMLLTWQPRWSEPLAFMVKTVIDYAIACVLCVILGPVLAVIAWCVGRDGGPILFGQRRVGVDGRSFVCFKFRSMRVDAAEALNELLANDPIAAREWATQRKLSADPRVTSVGHFLRKTSLDELPQLINVLRGEMSLVGPRPIVAAEVDFYGDFFRFYAHMKPGVTGLWQASGRSNTSYAERVQLDVWYARNWDLWQDFAIIAMTVPAVLFRKGAV